MHELLGVVGKGGMQAMSKLDKKGYKKEGTTYLAKDGRLQQGGKIYGGRRGRSHGIFGASKRAGWQTDGKRAKGSVLNKRQIVLFN